MATTGQDLGFAQQVADVIRAHAPEARVILYGSRARGDAQPDSDWDVFVVADVDADTKERASRALYSLEVQYGQLLSLIWRTEREWQSLRSKDTPFYSQVDLEGTRL